MVLFKRHPLGLSPIPTQKQQNPYNAGIVLDNCLISTYVFIYVGYSIHFKTIMSDILFSLASKS